jgi:hypothetical protein
MTTTKHARTASTRVSAMSSVRAYLIAFLATGYVAAWWWLGTPAPAGATGASAQPETAKRAPRTVWFDELPTTARPVVSAPAGWHIADRAASPASVLAARARPSLRASSARPGRVRTRSS